MNTLQERINLAISHFLSVQNEKKLNRSVMAKFCGVSVAAIGQWINGQTHSLDSLKNAKAAQYLGVNPHWLAGDTKFKMLDDVDGESINKFEPLIAVDTVVATEDYKDEFIWIDVVEAVFSCGAGESIEFHFDTINGKIPFSPSFMKDKCVTEKTMKIIKAKGDSMADFIKDGDLVGINLSQTEIIDGEIYAIYLAGEGMIKQIFKEADGSLVLHSLNEKYRDKIVTEENGKNFKVIGRQFWRAG
ncbi:S24 family peptidase [Acinetobacter sp. YH01026]|uniref:XRE family transcriptional regulator n=1 Tax=Acinetobacter sp. YH01026 TaxID=2601039 RepID=UPI00211E6BDB